MPYPLWSYFPRNVRAPEWAQQFVSVVAAIQQLTDTQPLPAEAASALTSDIVLSHMRPGLETLGYVVEGSKKSADKIHRPVLFGENGTTDVKYEIDAFHDELGIAVEVEAGRGANGNADYRDIVRTSLLLDARFMVLVMPIVYRFKSGGKTSKTNGYSNTLKTLDAIYASQRLKLPFEGVLLVGY